MSRRKLESVCDSQNTRKADYVRAQACAHRATRGSKEGPQTRAPSSRAVRCRTARDRTRTRQRLLRPG
eukprot:4825714-Pleurochrysis_carterae.AAC.2